MGGAWVYVENPSPRELKWLKKKLSLKEDLLKDALDPYEVPRIEKEKDTLYVFTRVPIIKKENEEIFTIPFLIVVNPRFILTLSLFRLPLSRLFIKEEIEFRTTQTTKFFLQLFNAIVDRYSYFLTVISRRLRLFAVKLEEIGNKDIVQFVLFERILNEFLSSLVPTHSILNNILSKQLLILHPEDEELVEDLLLGNNQLIESCKSNLKAIVNIREGYSTIVTNNLNRTMKFLTSLSIILSIPTIIASFYGMNVHLPLQRSPLAFFVITFFTIVLSLVLFFVFLKKKWL